MRISGWILLLMSVCCSTVVAQDSDNVAASVDRGKLIYEQNCLACHQADGSGVPHLAPPLVEGTFVAKDNRQLIGIILNGMQDVEIKGEQYANPMPAFDYLSDKEIADVLTFVRTNFKNSGQPVTENDVKTARAQK